MICPLLVYCTYLYLELELLYEVVSAPVCFRSLRQTDDQTIRRSTLPRWSGVLMLGATQGIQSPFHSHRVKNTALPLTWLKDFRQVMDFGYVFFFFFFLVASPAQPVSQPISVDLPTRPFRRPFCETPCRANHLGALIPLLWWLDLQLRVEWLFFRVSMPGACGLSAYLLVPFLCELARALETNRYDSSCVAGSGVRGRFGFLVGSQHWGPNAGVPTGSKWGGGANQGLRIVGKARPIHQVPPIGSPLACAGT